MMNLKVNLKKVRDLVDFKTDYWINNETTNCYAFALGLDIPEDILGINSYSLGRFAMEKDPNLNIRSLTRLECLKRDLDAIGFIYEEIDPKDKVENKYGDKYIKYMISLYQNDKDFHFLRKHERDGIWWHKRGWYYHPSQVDDNGKIITDLDDIKISDYHYVNTFKIKVKRRYK